MHMRQNPCYDNSECTASSWAPRLEHILTLGTGACGKGLLHLSARAQYSSSQRWSSLRSLDAVVSSTIHSRTITLFTLRK